MIGPGFVEKGVNTMILATTGDGGRGGARMASRNQNIHYLGLACAGSNLRFVPMKVEFCSSLCGPNLRRRSGDVFRCGGAGAGYNGLCERSGVAIS